MSKLAILFPSEPDENETNAAPELRDWPPEEITRIRLVLRRLTALRIDNPEDAEDLVQDTLLTMTQKCHEIELQKGLLVWGMGILRKKVGNYYRRTRRFTALDRQVQGEIARFSHVLPSADSSVHHAELRALVTSILDTFAPPERAVMDLLLEGFHTNEIAALLRPERYQNVVNRVHRGRKKLYKQLARHGYVVLSHRRETRGRKPRR